MAALLPPRAPLPVLAVLLALPLAACMEGGGAGVGMAANERPDRPAGAATGEGGEVIRAREDIAARDEGRSAVIDDLAARRSVLPASGPYARVAEAVLAASRGAAAAELRVNRLKSEARAKNWLPSLGPSVSLTSLNAIAAGLLVQQVLFDNGRRKAERDFAAADVEVAAAALAADVNARVHDGIARHIEAERAGALAEVAARGAERLAEHDRIVRGRVEGGIADASEARILGQKLAEARAALARDREAESTARAELAALTDGAPPDVSGLSDIGAAPGTVPLSVLRADAEARRMAAQARIDRAAHLPGLGAGATVTGSGLKASVDLGADKLLNRGTKASLAALEATEALAEERRAEARAEAERRRVALERQIAEAVARRTQGETVIAETRAAQKLYAEQFAVGRRPLMDLATMTETLMRLEREQTGLTYEIALLRLRLAREAGVLVDGDRM